MQTKVENLEGFEKKLTITLDAAEVDDRINKQYKDFAYRYNFPGFRKGKAPRPVVDNVLGAQAVAATVTDNAINQLYPLAMDENNLVAIGQPVFEDNDALVEQGKPFTFAVKVETRPEFELNSYDPVAIKLPSTQATDEEVDAQIDELRNYYYDFEDVPANTKIAANGFAELAMAVTNEAGEAVESLSTESRLYELGVGLFPEAFDEGLIGMKKGDKKTIEVDMAQPSLLGQSVAGMGTCSFDVEIVRVRKKVVPELTDEWVKENAGFDTVADLRERISGQVSQQKEAMMPRLRENEALYVLQDRLNGEAPESMLEAQESELLQNFFMQLQQSGMSFDMFLAQNGMSPDTFKDDLKKQAADVVLQDLALDAWARNAKFEITDEEISEEFVKSGAEDPADLEKQWREAGRIAALRMSMLRNKALDQIIETLEVTELAPGEKLPERNAKDDEKKPAKKSAAKKSTAKKSDAAEGEDAPKKKTAAKKTVAKKDADAESDGAE